MLKREDITRERIEFLVQAARKSGPFTALTYEEREENRKGFLKDWPAKTDLWVFGYGSLIWNPAFHYAEKQRARMFGYRRQFCLHLTIGRGSPENPGLMLALDHGGSCSGIIFRIAASKIESETEILWMREMISGAYQPHWANFYTARECVRGFTFVVNRQHDRYKSNLSLNQTIRDISRGSGQLGSCRDYLLNTVACLEEWGIRDSYLNRLTSAL